MESNKNQEDKLLDKKGLLFDDLISEYLSLHDDPSEESVKTFFFDRQHVPHKPKVSDFYKNTIETLWRNNRSEYMSGNKNAPECLKNAYDDISNKEMDKYSDYGVHGYDNEYVDDIEIDDDGDIDHVVLIDGVYPIDLEENKIYEAVYGKGSIQEAVFKGKTVKLRKPKRGGSKKFYVYVNSGKKTKDGKVKAKKVSFGSPTMSIKRDNPKNKKSFRARHKCDTAKDDKKARYWSCRFWSKKNVSDLLKEVDVITEDYPAEWSMETFMSLPNKTQSHKYASQHLTKIGSGSARTVYDIDGEKVLKIAKKSGDYNVGTSQNKKEIDLSAELSDSNIFIPKIFDYDEKSFKWLEMEKGTPFKKSKADYEKFKQITGLDFKYLEIYGENLDDRAFKKKIAKYEKISLEDATDIVYNLWDNNEFFYDWIDMIRNYDLMPDNERALGDYYQINHYGTINRNGKEEVILLDFGLDKQNWYEFYMKKRW